MEDEDIESPQINWFFSNYKWLGVYSKGFFAIF